MQIKSIISFLEKQGWVKSGESTYFAQYTPPKTLVHLPDGYFIEIAKDENDKQYKRYTNELKAILYEVYESELSNNDIIEFFRSNIEDAFEFHQKAMSILQLALVNEAKDKKEEAMSNYEQAFINEAKCAIELIGNNAKNHTRNIILQSLAHLCKRCIINIDLEQKQTSLF